MRKPGFCICENKGPPDQQCGNCTSVPVYRYIDSIIPFLPKSEISRLWPTDRFESDLVGDLEAIFCDVALIMVDK